MHDAIERVCCSAPSAQRLVVPCKPLLDKDESAALSRQKVDALQRAIEAEYTTLDASTRREVEAHMDPLTLSRFVLARPTIEAAARMFLTSMRWRAQRDVNALHAEMHPAARAGSTRAALARAHFYAGPVGEARNGTPLFVERMGIMDLEGLARSPAAREAIVDADIAYLETIFRVVRAAASAEGRLVRAMVVIDLEGASFSMMRHIALVQAQAKIASDNCT